MEQPQDQAQTIDKKKQWYLQHRNDPAYMEYMKTARSKYYNANKEAERVKALARYYRRKQSRVEAVPTPEI